MLDDDALANLASLPTPLPPVADNEVFSPEQWTMLLSICEVFVPSISATTINQQDYDMAYETIKSRLPESTDEDLIKTYLAETAVDKPEFKEAIRRRFVAHIPRAQAKGLAFMLSTLNTRAGSYITTGSIIPLTSQSLVFRTRVVFGWATSYLGPLRALYKACESLTKMIWAVQSSSLNQIIDYPKVPKNIDRHASYDFKFLDFTSHDADVTATIEADIVIVGSGCGSGVVADHLGRSLSGLERPLRILVLEKGYHFPSTHFPMDVTAAGTNLQEGGGGILSDDGSIAVIAGSVFGGGGLINWSASLQPQHFVREDWARRTKSPFFLSQEFQSCLDEVCDRMGVCRVHDHKGLANIEHNKSNKALLEGARRLGLTAEVVPQNTAGKSHSCGRCHYGCAAATKQGPANLWLPSAADHGVEFIEGCFVEKIIWDETAPVSGTKQAVALKTTWTSRDRTCTRSLEVKADQFILSSGTLQSPLLLHRSGLTPEVNKHIGSNLHLHPVVSIRGTYSDRVDPWDGSILTAAMTSFENTDGKGHGCKIEMNLGTPDMVAAIMPYRPQLSLQAMTQPQASMDQVALKTALDYKLRLAEHGYSFTYIALQRDHADETNSRKCYVYNDTGDAHRIKIQYNPSIKDRESVWQGVIAAARMHYAMGAESIEIFTTAADVFKRHSVRAESAEADDKAFESWLAELKSRGISVIDPRVCRFGSAHQMSTCRMSSSPNDGVVDTNGKVWGTSNVFVADASILPSASGVNPMISTMGLSLHVAKAIEKEVRGSC